MSYPQQPSNHKNHSQAMEAMSDVTLPPRDLVLQVALLHIGSGEGWIDVTLNIIGAQGAHRPKWM